MVGRRADQAPTTGAATADRERRDSPEAIAGFQLYARFVSVDPAKNRYRFYSLTWQPSLWGGGVLIRTWGRIGTMGRTLETFHEDRGSTRALVEQIVKRRLRRGYQVVAAR